MQINKQYRLKLAYILPPFALVAWGSLALLGLVRWYLFMGKHPMMELKEETWHLWISAVFPWIPIWFLLRPRFEQLVFVKNGKVRNRQMMIIGWLSMFFMIMSFQIYLGSETGKLLEVQNMKEIGKHDPARFYRIKNFAVHRPIGAFYYDTRVKGRHSTQLEINVYFVHPILARKDQAITFTPLYWYGVKFGKTISNWISDQRKQKAMEKFVRECMTDMNKYDFHDLNHFERKPESTDRQNFRKAIQYALRKPVNNDFVVLQPKKRPYENRSDYMLGLMFAGFAVGIIAYLFILRPAYLPEVADQPDDDSEMTE